MASTLNPIASKLPDCTGRPGCDPAPVCPACGGLECLCRPRFFAGQLLTEQDLNRLDHYIVAKNRLHNRYLHGWGVACGLEVVCNACDGAGSVVVRPGYALSPCGNDVVVCRQETVDVCALINRCRPATDDCGDDDGAAAHLGGLHGAQPGGKDDALGCKDGTDDWVLAVCYSETPARGITPQVRAGQDRGCGCGGKGGGGCGCGGSGKSGCGCGGSGAKRDCGCTSSAAPQANSASALPEQCEPTLTCEGYRFVVYKANKGKGDKKQFGAAAKRFLCCVLPLFREIGTPAQAGVKSPQEARDWVYDLREAVREFVIGEGFYDCRLAARLTAIEIPPVDANTTYTQIAVAAYAIMKVAALVLQKCFCAALLPPCPEPAEADCIPLATVTVTRTDCRVLKVCNLSARRFLVTLPNIEYWLSFLGTTDPLRRILERLCCKPLPLLAHADPGKLDVFHQAGTHHAARAHAAAGPAPIETGPIGTAPSRGVFEAKDDEAAFARLLLEALTERDRTVSVENLVLAAFDVRDERGEGFASPFEMEHPTEFLLSRQVIAPLLRELVPGALFDAEGDGRKDAASSTDDAGDVRLEQLARQLAELKSTVEKQQKTIAELKKKRR